MLSSATPPASPLPPSSLRGVAIAIASLEAELIGDDLVVEEILHHHVMCYRSFVRRVDGNDLVDSKHLAQERRKPVEQTV